MGPARSMIFMATDKSFIQMGLAPDPSSLSTDLLPVDFVAEAIVALARSEATRQENFHIFHPQSTRFDPVYRAIRSLGYPLETTSDGKWLQQLELCVTGGARLRWGRSFISLKRICWILAITSTVIQRRLSVLHNWVCAFLNCRRRRSNV